MEGLPAPAASGAGRSALGAGLLELRLTCSAAGAGPRSVVKRVPSTPFRQSVWAFQTLQKFLPIFYEACADAVQAWHSLKGLTTNHTRTLV